MAPTPEEFEQLLHHAYHIVSDLRTKSLFFFQEEKKASSTLLLVEMLKNFGHPATLSKFRDLKKGRPANNLLLLEVDSSWTSQDILKCDDGRKLKAFLDWGSHGVHVSDLLCFRQGFFNKFSLTQLDLCYDIEEDLRGLEYWAQVQK